MILKEISGTGQDRGDRETSRLAGALIAYVASPDAGMAERLLAYAASHPEGGAAGSERVVHLFARNLFGTDPSGWLAQMAATLHASERRFERSRIAHLVVSLKEGESLDPSTWQELVEWILGDLGADALQAVCAVHGDTDNPHCHIVLNRVDPRCGRVVMLGGKMRLLAFQEAVARAEFHFGLSPEPGALYRFDGERLWCTRTDEVAREGRGRFVPFAERRKRALAQGRPVAPAGMTLDGAGQVARTLREAASWPELINRLAACGLAPELTRGPKGGRGLRLAATDGSGLTWKASDFGRDCTLAALERRLGPATGVAEAAVPGRAASPGGPARTPPPAASSRPVPGEDAGHGPQPRGSSAAWMAYELYREALEAQRQALVREQERQIAAERQRCERLCRRFVRGFPPSTGWALRASIRAESDLVIARIRQEYSLRFQALRQARLSFREWCRRGCPAPPRIAPPPFAGPAGHGAGRRTGPGPGWRLVEAEGYLLVWEREGAPGDRITDAGGSISWTGGPHADAAVIAMAARWRRFDLSASHARLRQLRPLVRAHGLRVRERPTDPPEWRQALARHLREMRKELRLALGLDGPTRRRLAGPVTQAPAMPAVVDGGTVPGRLVLCPAPAPAPEARVAPPPPAMAGTPPSPPAPAAPVASPAGGIGSEGPPRSATPAPSVSDAPGGAALPGQARTSPATSEARAASAPDGAAAGRSLPLLRSAVRTDDGLARLPGAGVGAGEGQKDPPPARPTEPPPFPPALAADAAPAPGGIGSDGPPWSATPETGRQRALAATPDRRTGSEARAPEAGRQQTPAALDPRQAIELARAAARRQAALQEAERQAGATRAAGPGAFPLRAAKPAGLSAAAAGPDSPVAGVTRPSASAAAPAPSRGMTGPASGTPATRGADGLSASSPAPGSAAHPSRPDGVRGAEPERRATTAARSSAPASADPRGAASPPAPQAGSSTTPAPRNGSSAAPAVAARGATVFNGATPRPAGAEAGAAVPRGGDTGQQRTSGPVGDIAAASETGPAAPKTSTVERREAHVGGRPHDPPAVHAPVPSPARPPAPPAPPPAGSLGRGDPPPGVASAPSVSGAPGGAALPGQARTSPATSEARAASAPGGAAAGRSFPPLRSAVRTDDGLARLPGAGVGAGEGRKDPPPARAPEPLPDGEADRQRALAALERQQALAKAEAEKAGKERRETARREAEGASAERAAGFGQAQAAAEGNRMAPGEADIRDHAPGTPDMMRPGAAAAGAGQRPGMTHPAPDGPGPAGGQARPPGPAGGCDNAGEPAADPDDGPEPPDGLDPRLLAHLRSRGRGR